MERKNSIFHSGMSSGKNPPQQASSSEAAASPAPNRRTTDDDLVDPALEKEYLDSVRKESSKGKAWTSVGGGLLLAVGGTLVNPLLAVPAAIVGIGAGLKMYKDREKSQVDKAEKLLATGDHAAENLPGEEGSSRPPLRRLIFLVRWASLQLVTDLDNGDLKPLRLERVFDETIVSFTAWVQRIYYIRAERSRSKREQETRLLKLHLSPLVRWLQSSPNNEAFMMINHEFSKEATRLIAEGKGDARIVRRCRAVFPIIVEVYQLFKIDEETKFGQLVLWITEFLRRSDICGFLAEAVLLHSAPSKYLSSVSINMDEVDEDDENRVEFPPPGVEQELEDDEFFSASEGEEDHPSRSTANRIDRAFTKSVEKQISHSSPISNSVVIGSSDTHGVPDSVMFPRALDRNNPSHHSWIDLDATELNVRGPNYLQDKVKVSSAPAMFEMLCFDLFYTDFPIYCVTANKNCKAYWLLKDDPNLFLFTVNWRLHPLQATVTYGVRKDKCEWTQRDCPERRLLERFLEGTSDFRNDAIKVIPKVTEGPWLVKKAVGQTPAIIGRKLKGEYHEEPGRFFEAEYDVLSTTAAKSMIGLVVGAAKRLVIDVGIVLEAKQADELPERILGGFRIVFPDLASCRRVTLGAPIDPPRKAHLPDDSDVDD